MIRITSALAALFIMCTGAFAGTINIATGTDGAGNVLAQGTATPGWELSLDNGASWAAPEVMFSSVMCCDMSTVPSGAAWVTDASQTSNSDATGWGYLNLVRLRTTFDLTGLDASTAVMNGIFRVADYVRGIYLNGTLMGHNTGAPSWFFDTNFNLASGFVSGLNTLEIRGDSGNSQWDGFYLKASVTASDQQSPVVPLPAGLPLLLGGLAALGLARRKA